jgi:hypothetical protein
MKLHSIVSLALLGWLSVFVGSAVAKPLTGGVFLGPDNHTIVIASSGDRICYQSLNRGGMVASVTPDPAHQGMYRLDGKPNFALYQPSTNTLVYGELNQLARAKAVDQSANSNDGLMKKCLGSRGPFFETAS